MPDQTKIKSDSDPTKNQSSRSGDKHSSEKHKRKINRRVLLKPILYIILLGVLLWLVTFFFGLPYHPILAFMEPIIIAVNPFLIWIQAAIIFSLGFLIVDAFGKAIY